MKFYGITAVSRETGIHESRLRRWEQIGLITPERITMGSTTMRVYTEQDLDLPRRAKDLTDQGITVRTAFAWARGNYSETEEAEDETTD